MQSPRSTGGASWTLRGRVATDAMGRHTIDPLRSAGMNRGDAAPGASLLKTPVPCCQLPWIVLGAEPLRSPARPCC
jgi:hypothetical protein